HHLAFADAKLDISQERHPVLVVKIHVLKNHAVMKWFEGNSAGLVRHLGRKVQVMKHLLGGADRLLKVIVDAGQTLDGLIHLDEGIKEHHKAAHGLLTVQDLVAGIKEEGGNGHSAEDLHEGRCQRLGDHPPQVDSQQPAGGRLEFHDLKDLHAERLHDADATESLLQDAVQFGHSVLAGSA